MRINLADLGSRRLIFSWSLVAPNCPSIHYNILASNCGSCPTTTHNNTVVCTDVPTDRDKICTFALQTVICGNIAGILSNLISVFLSDSSLRESIVNRNTIDNGSDQPAVSGKCLFDYNYIIKIMTMF